MDGLRTASISWRSVTELVAISMLAPVKSVLIGKGGIQGAEGGSLIQVWGADRDVDAIWTLAGQCSTRPLGGCEESLLECRPGASAVGSISPVYTRGQHAHGYA